jgi:hypothetical protein
MFAAAVARLALEDFDGAFRALMTMPVFMPVERADESRVRPVLAG